jgi:hypothetical protein
LNFKSTGDDRGDPSNNIEAPLLIEATRSTEASDENVQGSANEELSNLFPKWLMLAILVALFVSTAIAMGFLQTSENQQNWSFFPIRGVIGPSFVAVIRIIGIFALMSVV